MIIKIFFLISLSTLCLNTNLFAQEVYTINSTADDEHAHAYDNPNTPVNESEDGICQDELGRCTLRAAIEEAHNRNTSAKFIFSTSGTINLIDVIVLEDHCEIDGANQIEIGGLAAIVAKNNTKIKGLRVSAFFGIELEGNNNIVGDFPNYNEFVNAQIGLTVAGDNNKIFNNYFGITLDGTVMPNQHGIIVSGNNNEIGKSDMANGNVICGNAVAGIQIAVGGSNKIRHNLIGTTSDGRTDVGNVQGILISGSNNNIIGGDNWDDGNVISGNTVHGIFVSGAPPNSYSEGNLIKNNIIGLNPDKNAAVPNGTGITITNAAMGVDITSNIISGNSGDGISIFAYNMETLTLGHTIHSNSIGTNGDQSEFPNDGSGVSVAGNVTDVSIGQDENSNYMGNSIIGNGMSGVEVVPLQGLIPDKITIRRNVIHNNDFGNIFIDTSANYGIRPPYNLQYNSGLITGKHAIPNAIIDIYSANRYELSASAYFRIGTTTTDASGNFSYFTNLNLEAISATATDFLGNTSGFARINIITDVENEEQIPKEFSLSQNYPNPFNPSTRISWQSPVGSRQTLKIYDVIGNEVATLVDEYRDAGRYEVEFNASGLTSGVYFYKLQAGSYSQTMKMTVLK